MIGIIAAMEKEIGAIRANMENITTACISGVTYIQGTLCGEDAVLAQCGIGKVFAALCAQTMILQYHPTYILNVGVAGTLTPALHIGDIAVATDVVQHDMDTTALGDAPGLLSGLNLVRLPCDSRLTAHILTAAADTGLHAQTGTIATGDCFCHDAAQKEKIVRQFGAIACEMEGGAIGQVCHVNRVPFCVLRAISDNADGKSSVTYEEFAQLAADNAARVIVRAVSELK